MLAAEGIRTRPPHEHRKTYEALKSLAAQGLLAPEPMHAYEEELEKASTILDIYLHEKRKRGTYTYKKLPQANQAPAKESLANAETFIRHANILLGRDKT